VHLYAVRYGRESCVPICVWSAMPFPIKECVVCSREFELRPDKPGFANRCPECSEPEESDSELSRGMDADQRRFESGANEERRKAIRDLLYRNDA
jgi:predicted amidophosphoribosyltransferase